MREGSYPQRPLGEPSPTGADQWHHPTSSHACSRLHVGARVVTSRSELDPTIALHSRKAAQPLTRRWAKSKLGSHAYRPRNCGKLSYGSNARAASLSSCMQPWGAKRNTALATASGVGVAHASSYGPAPACLWGQPTPRPYYPGKHAKAPDPCAGQHRKLAGLSRPLAYRPAALAGRAAPTVVTTPVAAEAKDRRCWRVELIA